MHHCIVRSAEVWFIILVTKVDNLAFIHNFLYKAKKPNLVCNKWVKN